MKLETIDAAASPQTLGKARSKSSREKSLAAHFAKAKKLAEQRPDDHLSSILADLREINISARSRNSNYNVKELMRPVANAALERDGFSLSDKFFCPGVGPGGYHSTTISTIRYLSQLIRKDTTAVMELGSGWGSNIFQVYLAHGATRSKKIKYYGGEDTSEGQKCAKFLASLDEKLSFRSFSFDYLTPDVTFLKRQRGHILLFTSHSVEQVITFSPLLFEQLREISNPVTVVHFEPVGWQSSPELRRKREINDVEFFEALGTKALAGSLESVAQNAAWWSWRLHYNVNLLPIVERLNAEDTIRMVRTAYNFVGIANVLNPSSLIHYEFNR